MPAVLLSICKFNGCIGESQVNPHSCHHHARYEMPTGPMILEMSATAIGIIVSHAIPYSGGNYMTVKRKLYLAISLTAILIVVGVLSSNYLTSKTSSHRAAESVASAIKTNASANHLAGTQLQEAISNLRSKLPTANSNLATINAKGIGGNVAGIPISTLGVAERMNSFETTALEQETFKAAKAAPKGENASSIATSVLNSLVANQDAYLNEALSNTVLDMMLLAYGRATNSEVPYAQAQAQAEKNWANYVKSGSPPLRQLHGETPKELFDSPNAIKALQDVLTLTNMRNKIGGPPYGAQGSNNQRPGLVAWMTANLNKYPITIHNSPVPISELPKYLPATM